MRVFVGTSGFSYPAWRGSFYPEGLPQAKMLRCYAEKLSAVEINNTFYRMPSPDLLTRWAAETPEAFRFVLKAPRRISHTQRLGDEGLAHFLEVAGALGGRLGPVLFQTPPFFKQDLGRLRAFLSRLPASTAAAFEFRHPSWFEEPVYQALRAHGAALVWADSEKIPVGEDAVATARWGYLRLRRQDYDAAAVAHWAARIRAQAWADAWVFFKHEDAGRGPALATQLLGLL